MSGGFCHSSVTAASSLIHSMSFILTRPKPFHRLPDPPLTPAQTEANIRRLVCEIGWYGVVWAPPSTFCRSTTSGSAPPACSSAQSPTGRHW